MTHKICITGGPCSGKTEVISALTTIFPQFLVVPEVASFCVPVGLDRQNRTERVLFQKLVLSVQVQVQESVFEAARLTNRHVLLDRGTIDCFAYVEDPAELISEHSAFSGLLDWYDVVIHLVSLATTFPDLYINDTRNFRNETVDSAKLLDRRLGTLWSNHRDYHVVECSIPTIAEKFQLVRQIIKGYLDV